MRSSSRSISRSSTGVLYDGEPLGNSRFYVLDGNVSAGVARIVRTWDWDPLYPDSELNHPSIGETRYLRYEVHAGATVYDDRLTIEGFENEEAAAAGFTGAAVQYRRDPEG